MKKIFIAGVASHLLGCSYVSYQSDGKLTTVTGFEIGSETALSGASFVNHPENGRVVKIKTLDKNSADSFQDVTEALPLIIEGAVKGAVKSAVPVP